MNMTWETQKVISNRYSLRFKIHVAVNHCTHANTQLWPLISLIIYNKKKLKNWYFENINWDKSNNILHANICIYILVKKYDQSKLCE